MGKNAYVARSVNHGLHVRRVLKHNLNVRGAHGKNRIRGARYLLAGGFVLAKSLASVAVPSTRVRL